jgi:hypothetical protein
MLIGKRGLRSSADPIAFPGWKHDRSSMEKMNALAWNAATLVSLPCSANEETTHNELKIGTQLNLSVEKICRSQGQALFRRGLTAERAEEEDSSVVIHSDEELVLQPTEDTRNESRKNRSLWVIPPTTRSGLDWFMCISSVWAPGFGRCVCRAFVFVRNGVFTGASAFAITVGWRRTFGSFAATDRIGHGRRVCSCA